MQEDNRTPMEKAFEVLGVALAAALNDLTVRYVSEELAQAMAHGLDVSFTEDMFVERYRSVSSMYVGTAIDALELSEEEWKEIDHLFGEKTAEFDARKAAEEYDESKVC